MKPLSDRLTDRELISRGDLTLAYRARDPVLDRPVFVKILSPALAADAEIRARFEREAKAVARLDHPNLVRIYEYGEDVHDGPYMILEWLEGTTLAARIAAGRRYAGEAFLDLAAQLLSGLAALHGVGILHRDLKPDNILVKADGTYKITDFSLAALRDAPRLTHHEAIVGTPAYMSPEQAAGGAPGEASDLFSLGVVLWEAATGVSPFFAGTTLETLHSIRERPLAFETEAIAALPSPGLSLLRALLEKDASKRPFSAADALALLGISALVPVAASRSKRRNLLYLAAAVAVIAVWAVLMFGRPEPDDSPSRRDIGSPMTTPLDQMSQGSRTADSLTPQNAQAQPPPVHSEPQFVSPSEPKPGDMKSTEHAMGTVEASSHLLPDTVELHFLTDPWAHVFLEGKQVGTTPLSGPLRLPAGRCDLLLRNPAYPPILLPLELSTSVERRAVRLADHVALLQVSVSPWGEFYVDGEHFGTTPLPRPLFVSAGRHTLRVSHPSLSALEREFYASAGETLSVSVDLAHAKATVSSVGHEARQ